MLPGPLEDGGLDELLESRLTRSSSGFIRSSNWAMTAWHTGTSEEAAPSLRLAMGSLKNPSAWFARGKCRNQINDLQ